MFALTSGIGGSGFLAVYLMGYIIGNARLPQLIHILQVQDGLAWLSQIMMFLILGLLVTPSHLIENLWLSLSIAGLMIFIVRPLAVVISLSPFSFPVREQLFISWVGLRGAVPIILALYPWLSGLPGQELFFDVAFVVVLVSLVLQGWTLAPMARWLKLEVPLEAEPDRRMALDQVGSNDPLEVWSYEISERSPACDHFWHELRWSVPLEFMGLIRDGEWIQPKTRPKLLEGDHILVVAKVQHIDEISRVLAAGGKLRSLNTSDFFGDFTLNGDLSLADVASFYPLGRLPEAQASMSLHAYFSEKFHRRMVVGDQLTLGNVQLTIRELNEDNKISKVGVKLLERGEN
ncbi:potassium/proton antiporter [Pseudidiomarina halophila]|uniref:potassium/proton antiporter n=1 Tax=Pseudidiomarina halophila TaxID=1449799 RepID=UPI0036171D67